MKFQVKPSDAGSSGELAWQKAKNPGHLNLKDKIVVDAEKYGFSLSLLPCVWQTLEQKPTPHESW